MFFLLDQLKKNLNILVVLIISVYLQISRSTMNLTNLKKNLIKNFKLVFFQKKNNL